MKNMHCSKKCHEKWHVFTITCFCQPCKHQNHSALKVATTITLLDPSFDWIIFFLWLINWQANALSPLISLLCYINFICATQLNSTFFVCCLLLTGHMLVKIQFWLVGFVLSPAIFTSQNNVKCWIENQDENYLIILKSREQNLHLDAFCAACLEFQLCSC